MSYRRCLALVVVVALGVLHWARAQAPGTGPAPGSRPPVGATSDLELVEKLLIARRNYQTILEQLRAHYLQVGDQERARWAEEELRQYHRMLHQAFRLELDVPPPTLRGNTNVPDANKVYMRAMAYKDKGWGTDYIDNQRRAELLLQKLLTVYPESDKIADAAFMLGDVYESKANKQFRRAAAYYDRCYQWNPSTQFDARLRAARLYDRVLMERGKAIEIYREVTTHETDPKRVQEAEKRLSELSGSR